MVFLAEEESISLFQVFDQSSKVLAQVLGISYLDAFIETADNMLDDNVVRVENGVPDKKVVGELSELYKTVDYKKMDDQSIRRAIQMVMIRATKEDKIQANHQITPDTIAEVMGYLVVRMYKNRKEMSIFDPAVGTGNLLTTVMGQLHAEANDNVKGYGIDNDDTMISIASISAQMQDLDVDLVQQDSLSELMIPKVDLVVSDLPVGYYPLDDNAKNFKTRSEKGHSYAHHLLIEQSMNQLKPGGFGVFLVPSNLFQTPEAKGLLKWMQDSVYLQAVLNLPSELFQNKEAQKAIMILEQRGGDSHQVKQVMIGEFPSFKKPDDFQRYLAEIVEWEQNDLLKNK